MPRSGDVEAAIAEAQSVLRSRGDSQDPVSVQQLHAQAEIILLSALLREIAALRTDLHHRFEGLR